MFLAIKISLAHHYATFLSPSHLTLPLYTSLSFVFLSTLQTHSFQIHPHSFTSLLCLIWSPHSPLSFSFYLIISLIYDLYRFPISNADGAYFKQATYMTSVDADAPKKTPFFSLSDEITFDNNDLMKVTNKKFTRKGMMYY